MRVIAEIEYEVDDKATIKSATKAIKDAPHGSVFSTNPLSDAKFKRVVSVRQKAKEA